MTEQLDNNTVDLSRLPAPAVVEELSVEAIFQEQLADYLAHDPSLSAPSPADPAYKVLLTTSYREFLVRQRVNDAAQSLLLPYAKGPDLDQIGVTRFGVQRLVIDEGDPSANPPVPAEMESDEAYLRRILIAPDRHSTAGAEDSYVFHALSADGQVKDVTAINGGAGRVLITVLSRDGDGSADSALLDAVDAAVTPQRVRPLNDGVQVESAAIEHYEIQATLTVRAGPDADVVRSAAIAAAEDYAAKRHALGEDVYRDKVLSVLYVEGVEYVDLVEPQADITCSRTEAAWCAGIEVTV